MSMPVWGSWTAGNSPEQVGDNGEFGRRGNSGDGFDGRSLVVKFGSRKDGGVAQSSWSRLLGPRSMEDGC
jgi:hypothetical protein